MPVSPDCLAGGSGGAHASAVEAFVSAMRTDGPGAHRPAGLPDNNVYCSNMIPRQRQLTARLATSCPCLQSHGGMRAPSLDPLVPLTSA